MESSENLKLTYSKYIPLLVVVEGRNGEIRSVSRKDLEFKVKENVFKNVLMVKKNTTEGLLKQVHANLSEIANFVSFYTKSRLVIGLGGSSVLEVYKSSPLYIFPYIPSSSIKCILRTYRILKLSGFSLDKYTELERLIESIDDVNGGGKECLIVRIFGNQNLQGRVVFLMLFRRSFRI
ncbi:MAG: hypothetical protein N2Z80_04620 [Hydrogenothermaceae bacterium]|nr:hypothetical protein [Hydrogenothermaceae bacterium]